MTEQTSPEQAEGPKYPDITVDLTGTSAHAVAIIMKVERALRRAHIDPAPFRAEATGGDYDNVIMTAMRWVDVS